MYIILGIGDYINCRQTVPFLCRLDLELRHSANIARDQSLAAAKTHETELKELRDHFERIISSQRVEKENSIRQLQSQVEDTKQGSLAALREAELKHQVCYYINY